MSDSLITFARRHYENKIDMLANFDKFLEKPLIDFKSLEEKPSRKRMPLSIEKILVRRFDEYKYKFCKQLA